MDEQIVVRGTIHSIIFQNSENGYTVFSMMVDGEEGNTLTCVAYMPQIQVGEEAEVCGSYIMHPTYGRQLNILTYQKTMPTSTKGIEKYLGSGVIKGIGERLAAKIVKKFGKQTLKVIDEHPENLAKIKGITLEKALAIGEIFKEQSELRNVMIYLQEFGITPVYAIKIYKKYKGETIEKVKTNPYELAGDIVGIGFKIADAIAHKVGIEPDSPHRIRMGIKYVLNQAAANGHVYLPKSILLMEAQFIYPEYGTAVKTLKK